MWHDVLIVWAQLKPECVPQSALQQMAVHALRQTRNLFWQCIEPQKVQNLDSSKASSVEVGGGAAGALYVWS